MFSPQSLTVTRTVVKQTTNFGAVYVAGLDTYVSNVSCFARHYVNNSTGETISENNLFSIDSEADNGILEYGLSVTLGGYQNYRAGYHTTETDIVQIPYNYAHTYSQYSYAAYPEPLKYIFSYYISETNSAGYSDVPQRVEVQPKNFKELTPVTMYVWYDGIYKDGYDYRNVNESLSLADKLNTYLSTWKEKAVYGVNVYSSQTSLTDSSLKINFDLSSSMAIQWNNGETSTVVTRSDIPEYNFPLVLNTYTVKYNGNGATGGSMSNTAMTYGTVKNLAANQFSRTGYKFKGWSTSANGGVVYTNGQSVSNLTTQHNVTVNLYAVWEPITYSVKYNGNGATGGSMSNSTMTYDKSANLSSNQYSKTGYHFKGWSMSASGSVVYTNGKSVKNLSATSGATVNLYAVWEANTYTVKYNGNGATSGSMSNSTMTYDKSANLSSNQYSKTGYAFQGWSTSASGSVVYINGKSVKNLSATSGVTVNLYAVWEANTYTVKYNGNGATSGSMSNITMTYDKSTNLTANKYQKTGYLFQGWSASAGGSVVYTDTQSVKNLTAVNNGTVNLYAVWKPITYTIKYNGNGATSGSMSNSTMTYDKSTNLMANKYQKTGYLFQGWSVSAGSSVVYTDAQSVKNLTAVNNGTVNLYAVWKPITYTIKYNGNGATSGSMSNSTMTYDKSTNLTANKYQKTGYLFQGWSINVGDYVVYTDAQSVKNLTNVNNKTVNLYAVWKPITYTVTYSGNGATSGSMSNITMTYDTAKNLTQNGFSRIGYTFKEWNTKADGSGTAYVDGANVKNLTTQNGKTVTLYAQWKANRYTIVLNSNGGNGNMGSITAIYDTPMQLPINTLTRETEYGTSVFEGWNRESDSFVSLYPNGGTVLNLTAENNGTVHLYAVWDDCPWITAEDLYYTLEEAKNGQITYDELMNRALAHDREDGSPIQQGYNPEKGTTFQLVDYQSSDFTQFEHDGSVTQTYEVIDSAGSRYTKMITVHVVDTAIREKKPIGTTRFINEKYYRKSYENGGLEADSIWKTDTGYALALEQTFTNGRNHTPIISYSFTYEEIQQMKEFVENNGIGNSESTNALQRFYEQFM